MNEDGLFCAAKISTEDNGVTFPNLRCDLLVMDGWLRRAFAKSQVDGPEDSRSRVKNLHNWFFTLITISYVKFSVGM